MHAGRGVAHACAQVAPARRAIHSALLPCPRPRSRRPPQPCTRAPDRRHQPQSQRHSRGGGAAAAAAVPPAAAAGSSGATGSRGGGAALPAPSYEWSWDAAAGAPLEDSPFDAAHPVPEGPSAEVRRRAPPLVQPLAPPMERSQRRSALPSPAAFSPRIPCVRFNTPSAGICSAAAGGG
jgi:hypothetical protein